MDSDNKFISWFRRKIEGNTEEPPGQVWENISEELDVDQVWDRLSNRIDYENKIDRIEKISHLPLIALVLCALFILVSYPSNKDLLEQTKDLSAKPEKTVSEQNIKRAAALPELTSKELLTHGISLKFPAVTIHKQHTGLFMDSIYPREKIVTRTNLDSKEKMQPLGPDGYMGNISPVDPEWIKEDQESLYYHGLRYYFGFSGSMKNTWLLNYTTFRGMESDELLHTIPSFGMDLGLTFGYKLSKKITLQAEGFLISEINQQYRDYIRGKYLSQVNRINYSLVDLQVKFSFQRLLRNQKKTSSNIFLGGYTGFLQSAVLKTGDEITDRKEIYSFIDFGILLGYEYEYFITDRISFSTGLRLKTGLKNMYKGEDNIPASFRKTHTGSADANISLRYFF